jgi:hypothetical protein
MRLLVLFLLSSAMLLSGEPPETINMEYISTLYASSYSRDDDFGEKVAISNDTIVVSAHLDDEKGDGAGAVYVYEKSGTASSFVQVAILTASDASDYNQFGTSVAIDGDTIVVGAKYVDDDIHRSSGAVYIFEKPSDGWHDATETAKLTVSDAGTYDFLGGSVAIDGDTVVAGARAKDVEGYDAAGSAYIFIKPPEGWHDNNQTAKLTDPYPMDNGHFGANVAIYTNTVEMNDTIVVSGRKKAYVFTEHTGEWRDTNRSAVLTATDTEEYDNFGYSVDIDADTIIVGAPYNDTAGDNAGSAYIFVRPPEGWRDANQTAQLTAEEGELLGRSVAIEGDMAVVGASRSTYLFKKPATGWQDSTENTKLTEPVDNPSRDFGRGVTIDGGKVVVGAPCDCVGSAYVFKEKTSTANGPIIMYLLD